MGFGIEEAVDWTQDQIEKKIKQYGVAGFLWYITGGAFGVMTWGAYVALAGLAFLLVDVGCFVLAQAFDDPSYTMAETLVGVPPEVRFYFE